MMHLKLATLQQHLYRLIFPKNNMMKEQNKTLYKMYNRKFTFKTATMCCTNLCQELRLNCFSILWLRRVADYMFFFCQTAYLYQRSARFKMFAHIIVRHRQMNSSKLCICLQHRFWDTAVPIVPRLRPEWKLYYW